MNEEQAKNILARYRNSVAYPIPNTPFGYGVSKFKNNIYNKARNRGLSDYEARFQAERAYERSMKYVPNFSDFCEAKDFITKLETKALIDFTLEELEAMVERFTMANDDIGISIATKAKLRLDKAAKAI